MAISNSKLLVYQRVMGTWWLPEGNGKMMVNKWISEVIMEIGGHILEMMENDGNQEKGIV